MKKQLATMGLVIAAVLLPVIMPIEVAAGPGDIEWTDLEGYIVSEVLIPTGRVGAAVTRRGATLWVEFMDLRTKSTVKVKLNEPLLVLFSDGSRVVLKMIGPGAPSGLMFHVDHEHILNRGPRPVKPERGAREHPGKARGEHYVHTGNGGPLPGKRPDPYDSRNWRGAGRQW
jgi:hypothetical protein